MSYTAYINGLEIEMISANPISYTKQASEIANLADRQANFTYTITIPFTAKNKIALDFASLVGNNSDIPYNRNTFDLIDNNTWLHLIRNGWVVLQPTTEKGYNLISYDGIIDLFKAIENKNFGDDVDISELDHEKTIESVVDSFTNEDYRYIINNYGGKTHLSSDEINIDYLVPSVRVKYLFEKIFTTFGFQYEGAVFDTFDFDQLWITFPKGIAQDALLASVEYADFHGYSQLSNTYSTIDITNGGQVNSNAYVVPETGSYKLILDVDGAVWGSYFIVIGDVIPFIIPSKFAIFKNNIIIGFIESDVAPQELQFNFAVGDVIYIRIIHEKIFYELPATATVSGFFVSKQIFKINKFKQLISFTDELKSLKITDFLKEIITFFSLTIFIDKNGKYVFKTFDERLQSQVIDYTGKYDKRTLETTIPKNYAQLNKFQHNYNLDKDDFSDGSFLINDKNLEDNTTILTSKIFSHEKDIETFKLNDTETINIFPTLLWTKEINENNGTQQIKYKNLNNRFYFIRTETIEAEAVLKTGTFSFSTSVSSLPVARFLNTTLVDFIPKYYGNIQLLLNDFKMHKVNINLTTPDFVGFDLDKVYYFKQEQNYYFPNKILYTKGKLTIAEFYRIKYSEAPQLLPIFLFIENIVRITDNQFNIFFSTNSIETDIYCETSDDGITWTLPVAFSGFTSPQNTNIAFGNNFYVRLTLIDSETTFLITSNIYYFSE